MFCASCFSLDEDDDDAVLLDSMRVVYQPLVVYSPCLPGFPLCGGLSGIGSREVFIVVVVDAVVEFIFCPCRHRAAARGSGWSRAGRGIDKYVL